MDKQDNQIGLCLKYDVKKVETGETINNCFVLRPDKDQAAVAALRTYARVTPNKALANDIMAWIGADTADKSRLAEVLGVEELELIRVKNIGGTKYDTKPFSVYEVVDGSKPWAYEAVIYAINHPESIIRGPRLTEAEIAIMRAVGARWVTRDDGTLLRADLWDVKPFKTSDRIYVAPGVDPIARIKVEYFPSVKQGECVEM